ncbi:MAG: glycerol-3-phosphate 1-O-acyltransferase PlsY [Gemmatimonadaceae bacterium]
MPVAVALALSYLSGSIPTAYLAGRLVKGIDLRTVGSGNLGATNVYRVMGARLAALVFVVDLLKGALPVLLLPGLVLTAVEMEATSAPVWLGIACGVAAILGHAKPVFLLWRGGGKGVATAAGIFLALAPLPLGIALLAFVLVLWRTGYVSAGSLSGGVVLVVALLWLEGWRSPVTLIGVLVCAFVFWSHRANITRLRNGTEHRFSRSKPTEGA